MVLFPDYGKSALVVAVLVLALAGRGRHRAATILGIVVVCYLVCITRAAGRERRRV
jgi:hypothetical protein